MTKRTLEEVKMLSKDAKASERRRNRLGRKAPQVSGEPIVRGRGKLGELAQSTRDGSAWVGHTQRTDLREEILGEGYDDD